MSDKVLVSLGSLLASLGRVDELRALDADVGDRILDRAELSARWRETVEALAAMQQRPEIAYRCGVLALSRIGFVLTGKYSKELLERPSPETGFSLAELESLAASVGLPLRAAVRERGDLLVIPSVVHWRENHYAALVESYDGPIKVVDPTFGTARILDHQDVSEEASGVFLIPSDRLPEGWRWLSPSESQTIFGKGYPFTLDGDSDGTCDSCECPPGTGDNGPGDGNSGGNGCCNGGGGIPKQRADLPSWLVSEPYLNVWLRDTPLRREPNRGPKVALQLNFKQRGLDPTPYFTTSFGALWRANWMAYIDAASVLTYGVGPITVFGPDGRAQPLTFAVSQTESSIGYFTYDKASWVKDGTGQTLGFDVSHSDGTKDQYRLRAGTLKIFMLTARLDPQGQALVLNYDPITDPSAPEVKLRTVVDADGNIYTLNYNDASNSSLVTAVTSSAAGNVLLAYADANHLTSITDSAGITSQCSYDSLGRPSTLTTPYGTTTFAITDAVPAGVRTVMVTEPDNKQQFFVWSDQFGLNADPPVPVGTPVGTLDLNETNRRSTFRWGKQQVPLLTTQNIQFMTQNDLRLARIRHWLGFKTEHDNTPVNTLSWEVEPSPDGTQLGRVTWYDYAGKSIPSLQGSQILPSVTARVQPDGTTWYLYAERNALGKQTATAEYWKDGLAGPDHFRNRVYVYAANGVDLLEEYGPDGVRLTGTLYNAAHQPLRVTNTVTSTSMEVTVYTYNAYGQIFTTSRPSGSWTVNNYDAGTGSLLSAVDYEGATPYRTNQYQRVLNQTLIRPSLNGGNLSYWTEWRIQTNPYGLTVTNVYDGLGRLLERWYPGSVNQIERWHYELWPADTY